MNNISISLKIGIVLVLAMILLVLTSFIYTPYDPNLMNIGNRLQGPLSLHWFGTDQFGRDLLSRVMVGGRAAFAVGIGSVSVGAATGFILGAIAGFVKGPIGGAIMRFIDGLMAFPGILLAMMLVVVLGKGMKNAIIAIGIFVIPTYARLVYSLILESNSFLYLKAAKSYGASRMYLLVKHILPGMTSRLITQFSSSIGVAVLLESSLSFLGLGVQPPHASWGLMLSETRQFAIDYPYLPILPGIAIIMTVLGFNLIGDGLNDFFVKRRSS